MTDNHSHEACAGCSGATSEELMKQTMDAIIAHGHQVRYIFPTEESIADRSLTHDLFYTVGLTHENKPELVLTGPLDPRVGAWVLNEAATMDLHAGQEVPANELLNEYPVRIIAADPVAAQMNGAIALFGDDVTALQIVWPDLNGLFPGDIGFTLTEHQPIFPA